METELMEEGLGRKLQELSSASPVPTHSDHDNYNVDSITECWHCAAQFATRRALLHHMKVFTIIHNMINNLKIIMSCIK